jgi:chaperone required for assembly of F1-ATPase
MTSPNATTRKRFYKNASVSADADGGFAVELDGKGIKTPAGHRLLLPTRMLADAIAAEWNAQGETITPANLPLTRLANSAIDGVTGREAEIADDIVKYAASDLLCYRASYPAQLVARQAEAWDPILSWVQAKYDAPFIVAEGLKHQPQPTASLDTIRHAISHFGAFRLAALHVMTSLTGSALIALAVAERSIDANTAWTAAHVDEDWQKSQWGEDFEAVQRRKSRFIEFENALRFFALS